MILAAFEQCKILHLKLKSTISTLEDHNNFLTDRCIQSSDEINELQKENYQQQEAMMSLSTENISLRQEVQALQQCEQKFEEIRREVTSLRRINMQLQSNQKPLHFKNIESKYHGMGRLSDMQSEFLQKERIKCLKLTAFMNWIQFSKTKSSPPDILNEDVEKWQKSYQEAVHLNAVEAQTVVNIRRELLAKCDELDAEKRNVHKLSNRVRQLALIIAGLQERQNAEMERVVTKVSRENIGMLSSSNAESLSKIRLSMSPAGSPESPPRTHDSQLNSSSQSAAAFRTPRTHAIFAEQIDSAIDDCKEVFRQMAKMKGATLPIEDRRMRSLSSASISQPLDPNQTVEIMIAVVLNVLAKWKLSFPIKKLSATCYECKGKKWHLAVHGQVLKARVGAGYEDFLPILSKELVRIESPAISPASRN